MIITYTADFETTSADQAKKDEATRVWLTDLCNIEDNSHTTHNNIDEFMRYLATHNSRVYFHNLKFDGQFIVHYLLTNNFTFTTAKKMRPHSFNCCISQMGVWYFIKIKHAKYTTMIFDSLKKLPLSVDNIAKTFELPIQKLEIDYKKHIPPNYKPTPQEIQYIHNDTEIMSRALEHQFNHELTKMTLSSDALHDFKNTLPNNLSFEQIFPVLTLATDNDIRLSYRGGYVYINPKYQEKTIGTNVSYDVNSLYPHVMYNHLLPCLAPLYFEGQYQYDKQYPLYVQFMQCSIKLKKGYLPTLQLKNNNRYSDPNYITQADNIEIALTNIDLDLLFKHYHVSDIIYFEGYKFRATDTLFKKYIDKWIYIKENNTGGLRLLAKLMLNSLYGKFGSNPKMQSKIPYLEDDIVHYKNSELEIKDGVYIPVATFVAAHARAITITACQDNYDRFIYADTDSLHLIGNEIPKNIKIDDKKLGYWACEGVAERAKFVRAKTYIKEINKKLDITCCGMPKELHHKITFDNFSTGLKINGKLLQKRVRGGVVLVDTDFTIH